MDRNPLFLWAGVFIIGTVFCIVLRGWLPKNRTLRDVVVFFCGSLGMFLFAVIVVSFDDDYGDTDHHLCKWHIEEDAKGRLIIPLWEDGDSSSAADNTVIIECEPDSRKLRWIGIADSSKTFFNYEVPGELGVPLVRYDGGEVFAEDWRSLEDLNCDGTFDRRYQLGGKKQTVEILVDDKWLLAEKITDGRAITAKGDYVFSLETGKYELSPVATEVPATD